MTKPLWAPWRLEYIKQAGEQADCVFCEEAAGNLAEDATLLVSARETAFAILNKYPYSSGHLMIAPRRHLGALADLVPDGLEKQPLHRPTVGALPGDDFGLA